MFNRDSLVTYLRASRETVPDEVALKAKELYPPYEKIKGTYQKKGTRCTFEIDGELFLYKLACDDQTDQGTFIAEDWSPVDATSIWTRIDETHVGTLEDPIPATYGMEYEYGLYYIEDGSIYLCEREGEAEGSKITLYGLPSQLVGNYFTAA
ncbi:MAG: hypothetical protein IJB73_04165 [Firmicutes bacterium]|nr:hypothetical protein [Bacillota bacterium]MBQ6899881.1 hypothetical protein [Bacillota bacterium]